MSFLFIEISFRIQLHNIFLFYYESSLYVCVVEWVILGGLFQITLLHPGMKNIGFICFTPIPPLDLTLQVSPEVLIRIKHVDTLTLGHLLEWGDRRDKRVLYLEAKRSDGLFLDLSHGYWGTLWGNIWKHTLQKNPSNATCVTLHLLMQASLGHIWNSTLEKNPLMQPMWLCLYSPSSLITHIEERCITIFRMQTTHKS